MDKGQTQMTEQLQSLSHALKDMYDVISFPEDGEPDWERMADIFLPQARLVRVTPEGTDFFDLASFRAMATEMLDRGVYTSFFEAEVARKIDVFGSLAHVLSAYETKAHPRANACLARGINSIQLLWDGRTWRVLSLFWDEENERNRIDMAGFCAGGGGEQ
jgi:hypothetical protein